MRGVRYVGRINSVAVEDIPDDAMVYVASGYNNEWLRNGGRPVRARTLKKVHPNARYRSLPDACYDDDILVATALGADCFK